MSLTKLESRNRIKHRVRKKVRGSSDRPRLSVFRSNKGIECQLIDDDKQVTLASASTHEKSWGSTGNKTEQAKAIGKLIGERALALNIDSIVFDRSGYLYHGRVKALAEGAREAGLKF